MMSEQAEMIEAFLTAIDKIDPFGRDDVDMSPQQYRRYRIGEGLRAALTVNSEHADSIRKSNWDAMKIMNNTATHASLERIKELEKELAKALKAVDAARNNV